MGTAAVTVAQRNDILAFGMELSEQDRGLVRLCAAIGEKGFLQLSWRNVSQFLCQADVGLVRIEGGEMLELVGLLLDCLCNLLVAMADADRDDAAEEIEVFPPLYVNHGAA